MLFVGVFDPKVNPPQSLINYHKSGQGKQSSKEPECHESCRFFKSQKKTSTKMLSGTRGKNRTYHVSLIHISSHDHRSKYDQTTNLATSAKVTLKAAARS